MLNVAIARIVEFCTRHVWPIIVASLILAVAGGRLHGAPFRDQCRCDQADFLRAAVAAARARLRAGIYPRHRAHRRGRARRRPRNWRAAPRARWSTGSTPDTALFRSVQSVSSSDFFVRNRFLFMPTEEVSGVTGQIIASRAAAQPVDRRPEPARTGAGTVADPDRRPGRAGHAGRSCAAAQHVGRHDRQGAGGRARLVLLVCDDERAAGDGLGAAPDRHDQAGARLSRAAAGREGDRRRSARPSPTSISPASSARPSG